MPRLPLFVFLTATLLRAAEADLLEAIRAGQDSQVKRALAAGAAPNSKDAKGTTALTYAAIYGTAATMRLLIAAGADVNQANEAGITPLMAAIADLDKVRVLVEHGAAMDAKSAAGNVPMALAGRLPDGTAVVRYLMSKGAKPVPANLQNALTRGDTALAKEFVAAGVKPANPITALVGASISGDAEAVRIALSFTKPSDFGLEAGSESARLRVSPLMNAAFAGSAEGVRLLLEKGAPVNQKDNRGRTALMYAVAGPKVDPAIAQMLRAAGADESVKDVRGETYQDWMRLRAGQTAAAAAMETVSSGSATLPPLGESLQRGLSLLDAAGPAFFKANGCISCHNQSIPQMAFARLRDAGVAVSAEGAANHSKAVLSMWTSAAPVMWQSNCGAVGGHVATFTYGLTGLAAAGQPRTTSTDLVSHCLLTLQQANGSWNITDQRAPLGIGREKFTALAIRGLSAYTLPGRKRETEQTIARARRYLETAKHEDTQALVFRLMGLHWAGAGRSGLAKRLAAELVSLQRENGGWAQRREFAPDAYATGQALWALTETGTLKSSSDAYQRGANYLRRTQRSDGSWLVRSRGFGFQPYRDTGFPHGHDQWLSAAGTGFALMGLAPMAAGERQQRAGN